jgi:hypothetical protein
VSILAAQIPDILDSPTTTISARWNVVIDWTAPYNGGTPITSYTIEIRTSDVTVFTVDSTDCDGNDSTILAAASCTITVATLKADPYFTAWGSSIYARVIATNYLGSSEASDEGNGAIILTYPDEPINLANNLDITWGTSIGLTWIDTDETAGGTPVIDYTIYVKDDVTSTWQDHQVGVVGTSVTLDSFNLGTTYTFRVKSRNAFDFSVGYSNEVSILAAMSPEQPLAPTTTVDGSNVVINWNPTPSDNGSPMTGYKVYIR